MEEDEVELMDYLYILWRRKWLIIIPTLFCIIVAGVISFLMPQVWEIDSMISPSKFLIQTAGGQFEEIVVIDPGQLAGQINQGSYNNSIATELNLDIGEIPNLKAENLRDTKLVRISTRDKDIEKAKSILLSLFNHLKKELDTKAIIEIKGIDSKIKSIEIEQLRIEKEIELVKNKFIIVRQRKKEIEKELNEIRKGIESLEKEQSLSLKKKNRSESESLAMLLYSNEIQQSLIHHNSLNELLNEKKMEEEDMKLDKENKEERIKQIENNIDNLNERKGRIDYTQFIKEPTSTLSPVAPRTKLNVLIAGMLGIVIFTILAFFVENLKKYKKRTLNTSI